MRLPTLLLRRRKKVYKNKFGHILILAGSGNMLGAACLSGLAAMRAGAGLVTIGIPKSLNRILQKKISSVIMTLPLPETKVQTLSHLAYNELKKRWGNFAAIAIGPGLSTHPSTQKFILQVIKTAPHPLVLDADALRAIAGNLPSLAKTTIPKILTPHPGEMAVLTKLDRDYIEKNRKTVAKEFAQNHRCILVLKGHHTVIANELGNIYINKTGNPGMATAGSGDVLTGMIAAFLGQGLSAFDAAKYATYFHGMAGDLAAEEKTRLSMIATDIIDHIAMAVSLRSIKEGPNIFSKGKRLDR